MELIPLLWLLGILLVIVVLIVIDIFCELHIKCLFFKRDYIYTGKSDVPIKIIDGVMKVEAKTCICCECLKSKPITDDDYV